MNQHLDPVDSHVVSAQRGRKLIHEMGSVFALAAVAVLGSVSVASAQDEITRFLVSVGGNVHQVDHDDLSKNEICNEGFAANIALLSPEEPEGGHPVDFAPCDDGVVPIIDIHATLLDNGWALVTGTVGMTSVECHFNGTLYPCTWPGNGTFTIREINEVMKPGDRLDIHGKGEHGRNVVDFTELTLYYGEVHW